jgi:hypothetical protein
MLPLIYGSVDCGLNVDKKNYETETGARNRLLELIRYQVPVITTLGTEISREIQTHALGAVFPFGASAVLAQMLLTLSCRREQLHAFGKDALDYFLKNWSYAKTAAPLLDWLKNPLPALDRHYTVDLSKTSKLFLAKMAWRSLREKGAGKTWQKIRREL